MSTRRVIDLVTGNSSWWKAKKYRRATAERLWEMRGDGWRLVSVTGLENAGTDTRVFTRYELVRPISDATS